ncbi:uncharacterized protein A4U43_C07F28810 [Asparagus officinalis]|uniref:Uncharacterized protein n=1 Tax=Asparagus officinalis TaxID=4686 RepID=A0A5P1EFM0_ASPOF|nr:uncharacterized protein A4U43_C07F28810 [Asparagus officinalis]
MHARAATGGNGHVRYSGCDSSALTAVALTMEAKGAMAEIKLAKGSGLANGLMRLQILVKKNLTEKIALRVVRGGVEALDCYGRQITAPLVIGRGDKDGRDY